ncbi:MAG: Ig-like domain-containing protein [Balneola sp.]
MIYHINVLLVVTFFLSCATPTAPTGGPPDKVGPNIEETSPKTGTVNYKGRSFSFEFSEFVNRSSFEKELTIEPELGLDYQVKWKRKTATVEFEEELPDSTTIIVTVGGKTSDTRGNGIGAPKQLAISTGDKIDEGEIFGRIRNAETGKPQTSVKVLLYREPVNFDNRATYSAEPDTGGSFKFGYLREGGYRAIILDDRNRNKIWDKENETALPFNKEYVKLEENGKDTLDVAYWFQADTTSPKLQAVGLLSSQRLRLRFSEEVRFTSTTNITVLDSLGNFHTTAYPLYIPEKESFLAFAYANKPLKADSSYSIDISNIFDESGNEAIDLQESFLGSNQDDTVTQDILTFNGENGLFPDQNLEVEFIRPITEPEILDSSVVVEGEVDFKNWPNMSVLDNKLTISPQGNWLEGVDYRFLIWNPKTRRRQLLNPNIWDAVNFGGVEVEVLSEDTTDVFTFKLFDDNSTFEIDTTFNGRITIDDIPPIEYTLVIYNDINGNGIWDFGEISPFVKPEPYYIQQRLKIQQGFTSEIKIDFR